MVIAKRPNLVWELFENFSTYVLDDAKLIRVGFDAFVAGYQD